MYYCIWFLVSSIPTWIFHINYHQIPNMLHVNEGNEVCLQPGMFVNTQLFLWISWTIFERSPDSDLCVCTPHPWSMPFSLSKWCNTSDIGWTALSVRMMSFGFLLAPRWLTTSLHKWLRYSMWRSAGMFRPGKPWVLTNVLQISCSESWGGSK